MRRTESGVNSTNASNGRPREVAAVSATVQPAAGRVGEMLAADASFVADRVAPVRTRDRVAAEDDGLADVRIGNGVRAAAAEMRMRRQRADREARADFSSTVTAPRLN